MGRLGLFDEDARLELIDGEIVEMAPIGSRHFLCVTRLNQLLGAMIGDLAVVSPQNPVRLDDFSEPQPDLALIRAPLDRYQGRLPGPADTLLVIEVADTTLRHDRAKSVFYARAGIAECWIVNIGEDTVEALKNPGKGGYEARRVAGRGERLHLGASGAASGGPAGLLELDVLVDEVLGPGSVEIPPT